MHGQKGYKPEMLSDGPVADLVRATNDVLSEPLRKLGVSQEVPPELTAALEQNSFYFSGFKTHHEMVEASRLMKGEDGTFKPFEQFQRDVQRIDSTYNRSYLQAEYNFAVQSTQMAVKWKEWEKDGDDYDLQYRTAGDDRVREEHAVLDGTTLPPSDPFWNNYLPPLGWNCRCTAVQVRKGKYPQSDSADAIAKGQSCTAKPKQQIFRFNPGKQEKIFPPKHPYYKTGSDVVQHIKNSDYEEIETKNGRLRIHREHGRKEKSENINIGTYFANKYGYDIDLLKRKDNEISPDSYNRTLAIFQEYKSSTANTQNSIDRLIRDGKRQADNIVLKLNSNVSFDDLSNAMNDRVRRSPNIKSITILIDNKDSTYFRDDIISNDFKIKTSDLK